MSFYNFSNIFESIFATLYPDDLFLKTPSPQKISITQYILEIHVQSSINDFHCEIVNICKCLLKI